MAKTRREFTAEFKREAVALWETGGRPQMEIAAELGLQPSQLRRWQRLIQQGQLEGSASAPAPAMTTKVPTSPAPADLAAENARLRRDLERARAERDILKKAIGIFSETPR
jgi:transposase